MNWKSRLSRRTFLRGSCGVVMALPFLEGLYRVPRAFADATRPVYFVAVRSGNGVAQKTNSEPERFWPFERGQLTREMLLRTDGNGDIRTVGELADFHDKIMVVDGCAYNYPGNGCGHSGGGNQCLTAATVSEEPSVNRSLATGESLDYYLQRKLSPGDPEPLTLMGGRTSSYLNEVLSYAPPLPGEPNARLRAAERNPWEVYKSIFGDPMGTTDDFLHNQITNQRLSINDIMREQLQDLRRNPGLSQADLSRLDLHQEAIRDLEERMVACHLHETDWKNIETAGNNNEWQSADNAERMLEMMFDIVALAFACDLKRSATIQIGNGNDHTVYDINGPRHPFHWISHRIEGDGGPGSAASIDGADHYHYQVDRIQMKWFSRLVSRLNEYNTDQGTLLDDTIALYTNDLANGVAHGYRNLPYVIAGSGGGYLRTGQYIDARQTGTTRSDGWIPHNQFFNTIINAMGVTNDDGSPVDDFGHKGDNRFDRPPGGEIDGMKA
ncbi:MAG: DUF1552 domain-containing protein [Bradymonadaceae bacterium]